MDVSRWLEELGWVTEGVYAVNGCQPASAPALASITGIQTVAITDDAPVSAVQAMMEVGEQAF